MILFVEEEGSLVYQGHWTYWLVIRPLELLRQICGLVDIVAFEREVRI